MRTLLVKIIQILDGTPAVYGQRQKGQSVVELALVTPILIILLAGLVEIGWFANNYLTLLDVTRAGARRGTVLTDSQSPLFWDNNGSLIPRLDPTTNFPYLEDPYYVEPTAPGDSDDERAKYRWWPSEMTACGGERLFYTEIACVMQASLNPLRMNPENGIDDIIISGFALANVDASLQSRWLGVRGVNPRPIDDDIPQLVVAGRYPTNANECDVAWDGINTPSISPLEPRDPFDFNYSGFRDINDANDTINLIDGTNDFTEIDGFDAVGATWQTAEKQRGFSLFGNHRIPGTACTGSEWSMADMEALMNLQKFPVPLDPSDPGYRDALIETRRVIPPQGVVLVELFWQHELLLRFPLLAPVFTALGSERTTISVWAAFPLPSVEPYIEFDTN